MTATSTIDRSSRKTSWKRDSCVILLHFPPVVPTGCVPGTPESRYEHMEVYYDTLYCCTPVHQCNFSPLFINFSVFSRVEFCSPSDPTLCLCEAPKLEPGDNADVGVFISPGVSAGDEGRGGVRTACILVRVVSTVELPSCRVAEFSSSARRREAHGKKYLCTSTCALRGFLASGPPKDILLLL